MSSAHDQIRELLGPLDGERIPGGCDHCDAWQTVEPAGAGVWLMRIYHDDWCPLLAARERREKS